MMTVAAGIPSAGFIRYHLWMLVSPYYFATPENDWKSLFFHYLPESVMVVDPKAVKYFYGLSGNALSDYTLLEDKMEKTRKL